MSMLLNLFSISMVKSNQMLSATFRMNVEVYYFTREIPIFYTDDLFFWELLSNILL